MCWFESSLLHHFNVSSMSLAIYLNNMRGTMSAIKSIRKMLRKHGYIVESHDIRKAIKGLKSGEPLVRIPFSRGNPSIPPIIRRKVQSEIYLGYFRSPQGGHYVALGSDGGIPQDGPKGYMVIYSCPTYRCFLEGEGKDVGHSPTDAHYCYNGRMTVIGVTL
jgi:hypothetical protein